MTKILSCENCFKDRFLIEYIQQRGSIADCSHCNTKQVKTISLDNKEFTELFQPFFNLYTPASLLTDDIQLIEKTSKFIWDAIQDEWNVFNPEYKFSELLLDIASNYYDVANEPLFTMRVLNEGKYLIGAKEQDDQILGWNAFSEKLKKKNRFFLSDDDEVRKLERLFRFLIEEKRTENEGCYFRARNAYNSRKKHLITEMGMPPCDKALNGRANPVGIPYLYLASDVKTAIAEVRPYINDYITVGIFKLKRNIKIIDFRYISPFLFSKDEDFEDSIKQIVYLENLGQELSRPINPREVALEYLPTQYLCELIKHNKGDGVVYKSSLSEGYNLAIFENTFECIETELYKIKSSSVVYDYEKIE